MKVLVTGGAGFIGSNIVDLLINNNIDTYVIDNLSTGNRGNINKKATFYKVDITSKTSVNLAFNRIKPDICIHLAAQVSVQKSVTRTEYDASINIMGSINVLNACILSGVGKIIYASSAAVYGEPKYLPIDEKHPIGPISYYGISKYSAEQYIKVYSQLNNIKYTILRYSNVYGIRQDSKGEGGVISIFLNKTLANEIPIVFGDGNQTRDFIYVKDVAQANFAALTRGNGEIINVCANTQISLNELVKFIAQITGKTINPVYTSSRAGDIVNCYMNNEKAKVVLGISGKYDIEEGLKETIDYLIR